MGCEIKTDLIFRIIPDGIRHNMNHQSIHPHLNELNSPRRNVLVEMRLCFLVSLKQLLESKSGSHESLRGIKNLIVS